MHPSLVQSSSRRSIVLDGFWENSFGNIIDYDQLEYLNIFPSWKISGRGGKGAGGEEAHNMQPG
jgi:hypothetical protein